MLINTFQTLVHAQPATIWKILMDRVENPQNYLHGVESARIVERSAGGVVREMLWEGKRVRERILPEENENRVTHELLEHPIYEGRLITRLVPTSVQNPMAPVDLQIAVELERKSFKVEGLVSTEAELVADIENELQFLKARAEEMERG
ncbi:AtaL-like protein [Geotalea uraniireducens]|uniref:SRPBCC family protein n=1 Tax=Geotalea uraniireducens (strain Rf4) TaxID=351605 RepID=A5G3M3_GEOUR|nr:AtaL-like protein [Geotalea uraniireducens]ABQ26391.1 hypothetical protein Gura_2206 [Geotalea uraniireducens Rf4]